MSGLYDCWGCGRPAPSGVCVGPHPEYRPYVARTAAYVRASGSQRGAPRTFAPHPCLACGATLTSRRQTCSRECLMVLRQRPQAVRVYVAPPKPRPRPVAAKRRMCPSCGYRLSEDDAYTWCDRCAWEPGDTKAAAPTSAARAAS